MSILAKKVLSSPSFRVRGTGELVSLNERYLVYEICVEEDVIIEARLRQRIKNHRLDGRERDTERAGEAEEADSDEHFGFGQGEAGRHAQEREEGPSHCNTLLNQLRSEEAASRAGKR